MVTSFSRSIRYLVVLVFVGLAAQQSTLFGMQNATDRVRSRRATAQNVIRTAQDELEHQQNVLTQEAARTAQFKRENEQLEAQTKNFDLRNKREQQKEEAAARAIQERETEMRLVFYTILAAKAGLWDYCLRDNLSSQDVCCLAGIVAVDCACHHKCHCLSVPYRLSHAIQCCFETPTDGIAAWANAFKNTVSGIFSHRNQDEELAERLEALRADLNRAIAGNSSDSDSDSE